MRFKKAEVSKDRNKWVVTFTKDDGTQEFLLVAKATNEAM